MSQLLDDGGFTPGGRGGVGGGRGNSCPRPKPPSCCGEGGPCTLVTPDIPTLLGLLDLGGDCGKPPKPPTPCLDWALVGIDPCPPPPPGHTKGQPIGGPFSLFPVPSRGPLPSVIDMGYAIPLGVVPFGCRIVRIAPMYHCAGTNAQIWDDWGSAVGLSQTVEWSSFGVGQANSALPAGFVGVTAHASFTSPTATLSVDKVLIYWLDPDFGY